MNEMLLKKPDLVTFDPSIKSHRAAVKAFLVRRAWGDANLRFNYDPSYGSVSDMVQSKLLSWYVAKENFGAKPKLAHRVPRASKSVVSTSNTAPSSV